MKNQIVFSENGTEMEWIKYEEKTKEYSLYEIWSSYYSRIWCQTSQSRDNPLYQLQEISWDVEMMEVLIAKKISRTQIWASMIWRSSRKIQIVHRKDKTDIIEMKDTISIELVEKEAILVLDVKPDMNMLLHSLPLMCHSVR